ncbi:MAG: formyltransferase family protein [bacterium]
MNIIILTQSDPFYLAENIEYLITNLPSHSKLVGCVVFDVSPFGKSESFYQKALKTIKIFGAKFFIYYTFKFFFNRLNKNKNVKNILIKHKVDIIPITGSINSISSLELLKSYSPNLLISIAGNQIFKKDLIELAPLGCLNLHTALLPKYRGLMPSFWVLKNEEKYTGVSVFFVDEGIDSGPILVQKEIEIGKKTQEELIKVTKKLGMEAIIEAINKIEYGKYELIANNSQEMTYFSFPKREHVKEFYKKGNRFF